MAKDTIKAKNAEIRSTENKSVDELVQELAEIEKKITSDDFKNNSKDAIMNDYKWALDLFSQIYIINGDKGQENEDLKTKIKILENDLAENEKLFHTNWTFDETKKIVDDLEARLKERERLVAEKDRKIAELNERWEVDNKYIENLQSEWNTKNDEIKELKGKYDVLSEQNKKLAEDNERLDENYKFLENQFATATTDLENELEAAKNQVEELKSNKENYGSLVSLKNTLKRKEDRITQLERQLELEKASNKFLQTQKENNDNELTGVISRLESEKNKLELNLSKLKTEGGEKDETIKTRSATINELEKQLETKTSENTVLDEAIKKVSGDYKELEDKDNSKKEVIAELNNRLVSELEKQAEQEQTIINLNEKINEIQTEKEEEVKIAQNLWKEAKKEGIKQGKKITELEELIEEGKTTANRLEAELQAGKEANQQLQTEKEAIIKSAKDKEEENKQSIDYWKNRTMEAEGRERELGKKHDKKQEEINSLNFKIENLTSEKNRRPNTTIADYEELKKAKEQAETDRDNYQRERDQRPDITSKEYTDLLAKKNQLATRPSRESYNILAAELETWTNTFSGETPDLIKKKIENQQAEINKLFANQKPTDLPADWKKKLESIPDLEKRPTHDSYNKLQNLLQKEKDKLAEEIKSHQETKESLKSAKSEAEKSNENLFRVNEEKTKKIETLNKEITEKDGIIKGLEEEKSNQISLSTTTGQELAKLKRDLEIANQKITDLEAQVIQSEENLALMTERVEDAESRYENKANFADQLAEDKRELSKVINNQRTKIANLKSELAHSWEEYVEANKTVDGLVKSGKETIFEKARLKNDYDKLKLALDHQEKSLNGLFKQLKIPDQENQKKDWFAPKRWLTDQEIDWALSQLHHDNNQKIISSWRFNYIQEVGNATEANAHLSLPLLLQEIDDGELIFIPVVKDNQHWSLLVFEKSSNSFYHYDTLNGINWEYAKSLAEQILQARGIPRKKWKEHLIPQHHIHQGNGYDCGVAVIALTEKIIQNGQIKNNNLSSLNSNFTPERNKWRTKFAENQNNGTTLNKIQLAKEKVKKLQGELANSESLLKTKNAEVNESQKDYEAKRIEVNQLTAQKEDLIEKNNHLKLEINSEQARTKGIEEQIKDLENQFQSLSQDYENLKVQNQTLSSQVITEEQIKDLGDYENLKIMVAQLQSQLKDLENELARQKEEYNNLANQKINSEEEKNQELQRQLAEMKERKDDLENEGQELVGIIIEKKTAIQKKESEIAEANRKIANLESELETNQNNLTEKKKKLSSKKSELTGKIAEINALTSQLTKSLEKNGEQENKINDLENQSSELDRQLKELQKKLQDKQADYDKLEETSNAEKEEAKKKTERLWRDLKNLIDANDSEKKEALNQEKTISILKQGIVELHKIATAELSRAQQEIAELEELVEIKTQRIIKSTKEQQENLANQEQILKKSNRKFTGSQKKLKKVKSDLSKAYAEIRDLRDDYDEAQNERDAAAANFLAEQIAHANTQNQLASTEQQVNTEKARADAANSTITNAQSTLSIADLNNLPTMPSGKSLADLINFFNTPPTPPCSHPDYDTIKTERDTYLQQRDNYKNQWETHVCSASNCPQPCCQGDYERLQQKLATQKKKLLQKINQDLELGLESQGLSLKKVITRLEELLRSPLIELAKAKKTIKLLQKQLAEKDPNYTAIQQDEYQKILRLVKNDTLENCKELGIFLSPSVQEKIKKATTLQAVMKVRNKLIQNQLGKNHEELTQQKAQLTRAHHQERWIWVSWLAITYLAIIGWLLLCSKKQKRIE